MNRRAGVLALLMGLTAVNGCGGAAQHDRGAPPTPQDASPPERSEPREGELLIAAPPSGWVETGAMETPALRMAEYGPPRVAEGTLERLTFEAQSGKPLPDPIEFVLGVSGDLEARCGGFQDINISSGYENGYPTSVRLMICPEFKDSPHGQVVMAKAIQGKEQFYVITRRLQGPAMRGRGQPLTAQAMAEWTTHLKGIHVCDTRGDEHPCPASETVVGDAHERAAVGEDALLEGEHPRQ